MHLCDRGGCDRRTEAREHIGQRPFQRGRDRSFRFGLRERRQAVLEAFEVARHEDADDVGTGRQKLSELEIGRAHPGQRARQPRALLRTASLDDARKFQRELSVWRHQTRIDGAEHALARKDERGAHQARTMGYGRDHKRQPECSATMPPDNICQFTRAKPASRIMSAKALGLGNLRIDFDQILVGLGVARDHAAERRDHLEREHVIKAIEPGHLDGGEFQTEEAAAWLEHAIGLGQREIDPRYVANAESDRICVEAAVGEGERFRIAFDEIDLGLEMVLRGALAAYLQHPGIDVADGGMEARACRLGGAERDVAGAAGNVEQRERPVAPGRVERVDHDVLPDPVQASGHQIVHQIIARRHAVKHIVHQRLLVPQGNIPEAKMRGFARPIHYSTPRGGP